MLDYNPNTRITTEQALQHEYFTSHAPPPNDNVFFKPVSTFVAATAGFAHSGAGHGICT
jgi:hypothetical protein